jgi:hypothetical protein
MEKVNIGERLAQADLSGSGASPLPVRDLPPSKLVGERDPKIHVYRRWPGLARYTGGDKLRTTQRASILRRYQKVRSNPSRRDRGELKA